MPDTQPVRVGVSWLRQTCAANLRELDKIMLIHDRAEPIAALIPYSLYLELQNLFQLVGGKHT